MGFFDRLRKKTPLEVANQKSKPHPLDTSQSQLPRKERSSETVRQTASNVQEVDDQTPLHIAAEKGQQDIVKFLIAQGANVNAVAKNFWGTPLHTTIRKGHKEIVEILIAHGADVNARAKDGWTPLMAACHHKDIVETLIAHGADVNAKDDDRSTPLHAAARADEKDIVEILIAHGADVNAVNISGRTPLHEATPNSHKDVVATIIAHGADVNAAGDERGTPLHEAAYKSRKDVVEILIAHGADVNAVNISGTTPLHEALTYFNKEIIELLISKGADVNAAKWHGITPLHLASSGQQDDIVRFLIAHGANVNAADKNGRTPLNTAIENDHKEIVEILIAHGADTNAAAEKISLFLFDPTEARESPALVLGDSQQACLLKAFYKVVESVGGWSILTKGLICCHGDLAREDASGRHVGTSVLNDWLDPKFFVTNRLVESFSGKLKTYPASVGSTVYVIGAWPLKERFCQDVHNELLSSRVVGYLGNVSIDPNPNLPFVESRLSAEREAGMTGTDAVFGAVASVLSLPVKMGIRNSGECFGWNVPETQLALLNLSLLEQSAAHALIGEKIEEVRIALRNGDIGHAISLFEDLAALSSEEQEKNTYLEQAQILRKTQ